MAEKKTEGKKEVKPGTAKERDKKQAGESGSANPVEAKDTSKTPDPTEPEEKESYLKDLMAISGHGGLFRFVSQGRNGIIVESIETGKRMQAFATMKVSALEDIAVYTEEEEIKLETVFEAIHKYENGAEAISPKSDPDELKDYFSAVMPAYDRERVYVSDIKKILGWYNLLLKHKLIETGKPVRKSADSDVAAVDHPGAEAKTRETTRDTPVKGTGTGLKNLKPAVPRSAGKQVSDSRGKGVASKPGGRKTPPAK